MSKHRLQHLCYKRYCIKIAIKLSVKGKQKQVNLFKKIKTDVYFSLYLTTPLTNNTCRRIVQKNFD